MENVIDKELISHLLMLESDQQEKVLAYIKELLKSDEMVQRAIASKKAIEEGNTITLEEFKQRIDHKWKNHQQSNIK